VLDLQAGVHLEEVGLGTRDEELHRPDAEVADRARKADRVSTEPVAEHRVDAWRGRGPREVVVQDIEVPVGRTAEFLAFFHREVGIEPIWVCPLRQRDPAARWPLYELDPGTTYVNVGFWSTVPVPYGVDPGDGRVNRRIEQVVTNLGGRKSLYSTAFYDQEEFARLYGGATYDGLRESYDPEGRLPEMWAKTVGRS